MNIKRKAAGNATKKRVPKIISASEKYQGAFDKEDLLMYQEYKDKMNKMYALPD